MAFSQSRSPTLHAEKSCRTSTYQRSRVLFLAARRRRAALDSGRIFFLYGPCGPCALWKPPRYFSASKFARLVTARPNQVCERVRVFAIGEAPREFVNVQRQIFFADFVIVTDDSAFEQTPESFDCICVSGADDVLALAVAHHAVIHVLAQEPVAAVLIACDQLHVFGNGLAYKAIQR